MQAFEFRFEMLARLLDQQIRLREQLLVSMDEQVRQLHRYLDDLNARKGRQQFPPTNQPYELQAWLAPATRSYQDRILTDCQMTRAKIAELESQRQVICRELEVLRQRHEQLLQVRHHDWNQWRTGAARHEAVQRLEAMLRETDE